ncbi:hypothetical protein [Paenibacillus sedimenti]|uniref:Uncharacterized protein n=1 Tax=Paenibacillus sedimenti TaxID=2770274 RepID=A0A926QHY6_9BACL|nr:hypothetical protein [Paenibacillus sedimenti]MBD0378762.1 hypothetical protein [Paenibacillus sedimenti]
MLAATEETKITCGDIDRMIAEIDEGWEELTSIGMSCRVIWEDLVRLSQVLNEEL